MLGLVLALSLIVAFLFYKDFDLFGLTDTIATYQDQDVLTAVSRGAYSPRSPMEMTVATATATVASAIPTVSKVTQVSPKLITPRVNAGHSGIGISVGATLSWMNERELNAQLDDYVALGVEWVRHDIGWNQIQEKGSSSYNWTAIDRVVRAVHSHGLKLLPIVGYTPSWARSDGCTTFSCAPADVTEFANFARAVTARYGPQGIHVWEIWNEPNVRQFWGPEPDVAAYVAVLKAAHDAIKSVDPDAIIVSGGLAPAATRSGSIAPIDFLTQMYELGAQPYFDAFGFHPYSYPALPSYKASWNAWAQMSTNEDNLRGIMVTNGDATKQIWMTEYGAPTGGPGAGATLGNYNFSNSPDHVDEALQARMVSDSMTLWRKESFAGPLFFYSYKDLGVAPTTNENFFGLLRYDGSRKPAYDVLKQLIASSTPQ